MTTFLRKIGEVLGLIDYQDYYTIQKNPTDNKWIIYDADGFPVRTYARRRDAYRGAERSGFTLV